MLPAKTESKLGRITQRPVDSENRSTAVAGLSRKLNAPRRPVPTHTPDAHPSHRPALVREPEVHHVAVLDDVLLAFEPHLAGFLGAGFAAERDVVVVGDRLGADEALLEVGVDDAGGLRRLGARFVIVQARASFGPTVK